MLRILSQSGKIPRKKLGKTRAATFDPRVTHLLEIGPHCALQSPIRESLEDVASAQKPTYIASLLHNQDAEKTLMHAVGRLYCQGYAVDLTAVNNLENTPLGPVPRCMPRYQFHHSQRYWQEGRLSENFRFRQIPRHDLIGTRSLDWKSYPALVNGEPGEVVKGMAYEVEGSEQKEKLAMYETECYRTRKFYINVLGEAKILGTTFVWNGHADDLDEGGFDVTSWEKRLNRMLDR